MQGYNVGYYIRRIRQEKGISQEALYEGLCSRSTIHRIESGEQNPNFFTAINLLQRLGLDESSFLIPLGPRDFEICNLQKEIVALNAQSQFEQALERIDRLEKLVAPKEKLAQQFLLRSRALAGYWQDGKRQPYDYPTQRQMLLDALEITHPDFDLEKIERCLLSIEDIKSLNQIAITYSETGDRRFAIRIYEQLMHYPHNRDVQQRSAAHGDAAAVLQLFPPVGQGAALRGVHRGCAVWVRHFAQIRQSACVGRVAFKYWLFFTKIRAG